MKKFIAAHRVRIFNYIVSEYSLELLYNGLTRCSLMDHASREVLEDGLKDS